MTTRAVPDSKEKKGEYFLKRGLHGPTKSVVVPIIANPWARRGLRLRIIVSAMGWQGLRGARGRDILQLGLHHARTTLEMGRTSHTDGTAANAAGGPRRDPSADGARGLQGVTSKNCLSRV